MKIWHLPPRFLDTATLRSEFHVAKDLYERIAKDTPGGADRLYFKYWGHHKYIFVRLCMVHKELAARGILYEFDETYFLNQLDEESSEFDVQTSDIQRDMNIISDIWEDSGLANEIPALLELLSLSDIEQILAELNYEISRIEEEYEL